VLQIPSVDKAQSRRENEVWWFFFFVYFNLKGFREGTEKQKIMNWMVVNIPKIKPVLNVFCECNFDLLL
jgi:hypothetical protein